MLWWLYILAGWTAVAVAMPAAIMISRSLHAARPVPQQVPSRKAVR